MPYLGNPPAEAYTTTVKDSFSGDGSTTAFTLSQPSTTNDLRVVVENVIQDPTVAYSVSGTTLTFTSAPPTGTNNIYAVNLGPAVQTVTPPAEIGNATTFNSSVTVQGAFTSPGIDDNATSTAMTIDSSGNAIVGSTSSDPVNDGIRLKPAGQVTSTINGDVALLLNRRVSDGTIAQFRKDNGVVGTIAASLGTIAVNGVGGGMLFTNTIEPTNGSSTRTDASINLGSGSYRFQNMFLSGGVYLGGTGSANYLDDAEYGLWTPVANYSTSAPTVTYSDRNGAYTKVGNLLFLSWDFNISSISGGSGIVQLSGLPFVISNNTTRFAGYSSMAFRDCSAIPAASSGIVLKGFIQGNLITPQYENSGSGGFGTSANIGSWQTGRFTGYMLCAT